MPSLWAKFKAAQDQFFTAKNADLEKREVSMVANLAKREELIVQIEALVPFTDVKAAKNLFRELSRSWEKIGITHRDKRAAMDARVAKVEDAATRGLPLIHKSFESARGGNPIGGGSKF